MLIPDVFYAVLANNIRNKAVNILNNSVLKDKGAIILNNSVPEDRDVL